MSISRILVCGRAILVMAGVSSAVLGAGRTIHAPEDQPKIQGAINAAHDGDVVLVATGGRGSGATRFGTPNPCLRQRVAGAPNGDFGQNPSGTSPFGISSVLG